MDNHEYFYKKFKPYEYQCKCGCGESKIHPSHIDKMAIARKKADTPFIIRSLCRCPQHNVLEGGKITSRHLPGLYGSFASDIQAIDNVERYKIIDGLIYAGFTKILVYEDFIHAALSRKVGEVKQLKIMY